MVDIELVYNLSIYKLQNFQISHRESDGLRKLVLLNNFVHKLQEQDDDLSEWSEDIKKDEENWLDSCLDELEVDEDDYVHVNVRLPELNQPTVAPFPIDRYDDPQHYDDHYVQDNNALGYTDLPLSKGDNNNAIDDVIIPHDLLHRPFFELGGTIIEEQDDNNVTTPNLSSQQDVLNITNIEDSSTCEKGFHPYWKDNSIISHHPSSSPFCPYPNLNTRSFGIPKIFHKYRFDQYDNTSSPRRPNPVLELLQSGYLYQSFESPLRRSKDDLDILYSLTPRDVDRGVLMDMISMLEYYGSKANHNNAKKSEIGDIWFMDH